MRALPYLCHRRHAKPFVQEKDYPMQRSLLLAALLALSITACSKKEETPPLPAPAVAPSLPNADAAPATAPATDLQKPADSSAAPAQPAEQKAAN